MEPVAAISVVADESAKIAREVVLQLIQQKDTIEAQIRECHAVLTQVKKFIRRVFYWYLI